MPLEPTNQFRHAWRKSHYSPVKYKVLQQLWREPVVLRVTDTTGPLVESEAREEWRDVPEVVEDAESR